MKTRRIISFASRPLAALVGSVFFFSAVIAQLAFCQCGVFCPHAAKQAAQEVAEAPPEAAHSCCSPEGQGDAPAPRFVEEKPAGEAHGCPCPVQIASSEKDLPPGLLPLVQASVSFDGVFDAPSASAAVVLPLEEVAAVPSWRPVRGSPGTGPPVHLLNSVFLI